MKPHISRPCVKRPSILVSNDDGPASPGVKALIRSLSGFADVIPVIPEGPRSSTSMSLTFHKPLRIREVKIAGRDGYVVSGSPADAVMVALYKILKKKPVAMASGINIGDNTSLQDVFASGTVQASIQSAFFGIPSVAFSLQIEEGVIFSPSEAFGHFTQAAEHASRVMEWVCKEGLPPGTDILNVNYPINVSSSTRTVYTRLALKKYRNFVVERRDPRGRPYYWVWGHRMNRYAEGSDARAVLQDGLVSVTPLRVDMSTDSSGVAKLLEWLNQTSAS